MEVCLLFNGLDDILFQQTSESGEAFLSLQCRKGGLTDSHSQSMNNSTLLQLFSPLLLAQMQVDSKQNPFQLVALTEGHYLVLRQLGHYTAVLLVRSHTGHEATACADLLRDLMHFCLGHSYGQLALRMDISVLESLVRAVFTAFSEQPLACMRTAEWLSINRDIHEAARAYGAATRAALFSGHSFVLEVALSGNRVIFANQQDKRLKMNSLWKLGHLHQTLCASGIIPGDKSRTVFMTVFLEHQDFNEHMPYVAYFTKIADEISLCLVEKHTFSNVATVLKQLNSFLVAIFRNRTGHFKRRQDLPVLVVKKVRYCLRYARRCHDPAMANLLDTLASEVNTLHRRDLIGEILRDHTKADRYSSLLKSLVRHLDELFRMMFQPLQTRPFSPASPLSRTVPLTENSMDVYIPFIQAKNDINFSLEPFAALHPGLLHFCYVERKSGLLICSKTPETLRTVLHDHMWLIWSLLRAGHLSVAWTDAEHCVSYALVMKPTGQLKADRFSGVFGDAQLVDKLNWNNDFYDLLQALHTSSYLERVTSCEELFTVHERGTPAKAITRCRDDLLTTLAQIAAELCGG